MGADPVHGPEVASTAAVGGRRHPSHEAVGRYRVVVEGIPGAPADDHVAVELTDPMHNDVAVVVDEGPDLAPSGLAGTGETNAAAGRDDSGHARPGDGQVERPLGQAGPQQAGDRIRVRSHRGERSPPVRTATDTIGFDGGMPLPRWTIDVAAHRDAEIEVRISSVAPPVPADAESQEMENWTAHELDGVLWIGLYDSRARIEPGVLDIGGPLDSPRDVDVLDDLLQFAIAVGIARPDRLMVHAAVLARGDDALLVVGRSGRGKSTLAAAALLGGWELLGDDLAVIDTTTFAVQAVRRAPMVPLEIADRHGLTGDRVGEGPGERRRVRLDVERLARGRRRLVGLVTVDHGTDGHVEFLGTGDLEVLDDALAVPPFRSVIRRHLAAGAALVTLPAVLLAHAADVDDRVTRAQDLLDKAWTRLADAQ